MTAGHQNLHNLASRHDWRCHYCGRRVWCRTCCPGASRQTEATRDHIIPRSKGGRGPANLTLSCWACNHDKADRMPGEPPPKPSRKVGCRAGKRRRPRTAFATRALAEHMCTAVRDAHDADLAPYECTRCGQWHIKKRAAVAEPGRQRMTPGTAAHKIFAGPF